MSTDAAVAKRVEQMVQFMLAFSTCLECSAGEVSKQKVVSYGSIWRALRIALKWYPYKLQHNHELKSDFDSRKDFTNFGIQ